MERAPASTAAPFPTVLSEGGLLPADVLGRIARRDGELGHFEPAAYGLPRGLGLSEAIARAWQRARADWADFRDYTRALSAHETGVRETRDRWLLPLLRSLGYAPEFRREAEEAGGERYVLSHRDGPAQPARDRPVALHLVSFRDDLDHPPRAAGAGTRRVSPHTAMQEYLNRRAGALYGVIGNGKRLRLLRQNLSLTRLAYVEFDLEAMLDGGVYGDFALLWLTLHRSRLPRGSDERCVLEEWRETAEAQGVRAMGALRGQVQEALKALGTGLLAHPANERLRERLRGGDLAAPDFYAQLLRLLYRILFLLVVEERGQLFAPEASDAARERYLRNYSVSRLQAMARRYVGDTRHDDLWRGLQVVFRILGDDLPGEPLGLPALGGLFAPGSCPDLDDPPHPNPLPPGGEGASAGEGDGAALIANDYLARAIGHLSRVPDKKARRWRRVNYGAMGVEELGGVYEGLLDLAPVVVAMEGTAAAFDLRASVSRKQTGSYYTPEPLVQELIRSALDPVIDDRLQGPDPARQAAALLSITVCDPACGSGHFLLAAAERLAGKLAGVRALGREPSVKELYAARRDVIRACLYGVDANPLAVELCRLGLWLQGHDAGLPLTFLAHRIKCGNSLIGAFPHLLAKGIPDGAYNPVTLDDRLRATETKKANRAQRKPLDKGAQQLPLAAGSTWQAAQHDLGLRLREIARMPNATPADVAAEEEAHATFRRERVSALREAFDTWTAAFFWLLQPGETEAPTTAALLFTRPDLPPALSEVQRHQVAQLRDRYGFFHWPLEFADVFDQGGFDVVLGNPPWERIKLQEQEFFAGRDDEIAGAPNKAARQRLIDALQETNPSMFAAFLEALREADCDSKFARGSQRFPLTAVADINLYALFSEHALTVLNDRGRAGILVPTGIATDDTTKRFFGRLVNRTSLAGLYSFIETRDLFPDTDSRSPFCLLTLSGAPVERGDLAFFLANVGNLADANRRFQLAPEDFVLLNPNTRTCPVFRTRADADLTRSIYRHVPVLVNETIGENPWGVSFLRMIDMANDSGLFYDEPGPGRLPLYEAKLLHHFNHRWGDYALRMPGTGGNELPTPSAEQLADPSYRITPRYWVDAAEVDERLKSRVPDVLWDAYRRGNEKLVGQAMVLWLAGYLLNHGKAIDGNDLLDRLFKYVYVDAHVLHGEATKRMEAEYPITERDIQAVQDCTDFMEMAAVLIQARRPRWLLAFRDVARNSDERTAILAVLPRVGVGHKAPLVLPASTPRQASAIVGNANAMVLDYVVRQKMGGTSLSYFILKQLPVLPPSAYTDADLSFIASRVLELTYTAHDLAPFARDVGYGGPPFTWDEERRAVLRGELDAYYAALYGLSRKQLRYVLDPHDLTNRELEDILDDREDPPDAPRTTTFPGETFRVLKAREIRECGEYRTRRLVLEAWDRLGLAPRRVDYQQRQADPRGNDILVIDTGAQSPKPHSPVTQSKRAEVAPNDGKASAVEVVRPAPRPAETTYRRQPRISSKKVAERRATTTTLRATDLPAPRQTPLPGIPAPDEKPAATKGSESELRQRVLQRCLETLAVAGPLRARDLAQRLASLDPRVDRHLVNSVLFREGAERVRRDPVTGLYRLRGP